MVTVDILSLCFVLVACIIFSINWFNLKTKKEEPQDKCKGLPEELQNNLAWIKGWKENEEIRWAYWYTHVSNHFNSTTTKEGDVKWVYPDKTVILEATKYQVVAFDITPDGYWSLYVECLSGRCSFTGKVKINESNEED